MSTANKLTYLNATKDKLKNVINYAGANITTDTFRSYPEKLYDKLVDFVTNGTDSLYNSLPKVTGENTELTLNNTANGVLKLDLKGNTSQNDEPTPSSPQDIHVVTGDNDIKIQNKNVFDKENVDWYRNNNTYFNATANSNTTRIRTTSFSIVGGKTYTISGIPNGISLISVGYFYEENGERQGGINSSLTFTLNEQVKYIYLLFGGSNFTDETNELMKNADIQIEEGSIATDYVAHQGQTYRVDFGGKNKVDFNNASYVAANYATVTKNGELYTVENGSSNSGSVRFENIDLLLKPNTTYTVSALIVSTTAINGSCVYVSPGLRVEGTSVFGNRVSAGERSYVTFTTPSTLSTGNIALTPREANTTAVFTDIMIEEGTEATRYSRYVENPIELCKIGDYQDYIYKENGNWYKYGAIGKVILNSELNWKFSNGVAYMNSGVFPSNYVLNQPIYSNYYDYGGTATNTSTAYSNGNNKISLNTADGTSIYIRNDNITSASDFKTWLSTHNTEVYYILATATTTQITDTTLIEQLDELANAVSYADETNISQTNADLPFIISASAIRKYSE